MPLHLQEFTREAFQGYIENVPPAKERILSRFMPVKTIFDIKFSHHVITGKYARTASITGFNAGAPLRSRQGLEKVFGEVAKVQHGFKLDEEELLQYNNARSDEEAKSVVEGIYDNTDELIEGIRDIEEWMRGQAIYHGELKYTGEHDMVLDIPFDIPTENKITLIGTEAFSDHANSEPLTVLQERVTQYKNANKQKNPAEMHMSSTMVNDLLSNAQIKNHIYGSPTDARIVTRDQLQTLLNSLGLPRFVIQDEVIDLGEGDVRLLPERRIAFLGEDLGKTYLGITVENNYKPGMYVVPEIKETNPPMQAVFVGETVFPGLAKPQAISFIDA